MSTMVVDGPTEAVDQLTAAVDTLLSLDRTRLGLIDALALVRDLEVVRRRLEAVDQDNIAHLIELDAAQRCGAANTAAVLIGALRITPAEAGARVRAAKLLGPRRALTGEALEPVFPVVSAAVRQGSISAGHAAAVTTTINKIPQPLRAEHAGPLEEHLVACSRQFHPNQVSQLGLRALAHLDPDGQAPRDTEHRRHRSLRISEAADGSGRISGYLTPACLALARAALDPLAQPNPAGTPSGSSGEPVVRDQRTAGQRYHDGFEDALLRLLKDGGLPETGGAPTTLLITLTLSDLETRVGTATTEHGGTLSVAEALRLAADAELIPILFNDTGGILNYGRTRRTASPAQRRALAARDKGCTMPGCDRPASWCQAHHVTDWVNGGLTNIDAMALLCGHHHRTFEQAGWTCQMIDNVPHWKPPPWIDPHRQPIRNTAHG